MNSFTRSAIATLRNDINAALQTVAAKHGLIISLDGSARFGATEVTFSKIKAIPIVTPSLQNRPSVTPTSITTGTDPFNTLESREYLNLGYLHGLKKEWLGKSFVHLGSSYRIVGLKSSRPKFPLIGVSQRGARYKFPAAVANANTVR